MAGDMPRRKGLPCGSHTMRGRLVALASIIALCARRERRRRCRQVEPGDGRDHGLRRLVDDAGPARDRHRQHVLVRQHRHARDADHERRTRRRPDGREHDDLRLALRLGRRREAGQLHAQHARRRRSEVEPGRDQVDLRPDEAGDQDRRGGLVGAGRQLHGPGAEPDGPQLGRSRRTSSARRPRTRTSSRRSRSARSTPASSTSPTT